MLNRDFKEFADSLNARGVDYLVGGGYALAAHGQLEDFKVNKRAGGRLQDLADLEALEPPEG